MGEILAIAGEIGIKETRAKRIANDIRECVDTHLSSLAHWYKLPG